MKASSSYLNDNYKLQKLIQQRNYQEAKFLKEKIDRELDERLIEFQKKYVEKYNLHKKHLIEKQAQEQKILN